MSRGALRYRGVWLVTLAVGFWALAVGLTSLLVCAGYAIVTYAPDYTLAGIAAWGIAITLAVGFVPRGSPKREDDATPVAPSEHPRLHTFVRDVAKESGARAPDRLYVFHGANAFAGARRKRRFARRESMVGIGLPLLAVLTESEARAVLAHEMGHHVVGDVKLGPWVHRTRRAIAVTIDRLEGSSFWLHLPFIAYAELFLKTSVRISRAQELAADALAARVAGATVTASALRKTEVIGSAWGVYFQSEVVPLLAKGRLPPLLDGWGRYWAAAQTPDTPAYEALARGMETSKQVAEGDTHPPLAERITALGDPGPLSDGAPPALSLLDDVAQVEVRVLRALLRDDAKVESIAWDSIADEFWLPIWRQTIDETKSSLERLTIAEISNALRHADTIAEQTRLGPSISSPAAERRRVVHLLSVWFVVALSNRGWRVETPPGRAVRATLEGKSIEPFAVVAREAAKPDRRAWTKMCEDNGL